MSNLPEELKEIIELTQTVHVSDILNVISAAEELRKLKESKGRELCFSDFQSTLDVFASDLRSIVKNHAYLKTDFSQLQERVNDIELILKKMGKYE